MRQWVFYGLGQRNRLREIGENKWLHRRSKWGTLFGFFVGHDHPHQSVVVFYDSGTGTMAERQHERERERERDGLKRSLWGGGFHFVKWHSIAPTL